MCVDIVASCKKTWNWQMIFFPGICRVTLQGTNISPQNGILKMIFLFPRWDMLIPWRVMDLLELDLTSMVSIVTHQYAKRGLETETLSQSSPWFCLLSEIITNRAWDFDFKFWVNLRVNVVQCCPYLACVVKVVLNFIKNWKLVLCEECIWIRNFGKGYSTCFLRDCHGVSHPFFM